MPDALVRAIDLKKYFGVRGSLTKRVRALDGITLEILRGETLGVVGESGCGKTTLGKTLLRLYEPTSGKIFFEGRDITRLRGSELRYFRRNAQMVFQDPHASLNPRMTIAETLLEPLKKYGEEVGDMDNYLAKQLESVGLEVEHLHRYPHELSGGQKQRVAILRAIILKPKFVVLDEPTSSLDVSVQAQILELLKDLQRIHGLTYMFISHDISVVRYMSNRMAVMYLGKLVEIGDSDDVFNDPKHPYSQMLLSSIPIPDPRIAKEKKRAKPQGEPPSPIDPPRGCRFHPRCPFAMEICRREEPPMINVGSRQYAACWLHVKR